MGPPDIPGAWFARPLLARRPRDPPLAAAHRVLPFEAMGEVVRGTLASTAFPLSGSAFLLLGAWCAGSLAVAGVVLARRA